VTANSILKMTLGLSNETVFPEYGTRARIAVDLIGEWTQLQAEFIYNHPDRRFPVISAAFMSLDCQWQLAGLYSSLKSSTLELTLENIDDKVPLLREWEYREEYGSHLVDYLQSIVEEVEQTHTALSQQRETKPISQINNLQVQHDQEGVSHLDATQRYHEMNRRKDDALCMKVAIQEATIKALTQNTATYSSPPTRTTPTQRRGSQLPLVEDGTKTSKKRRRLGRKRNGYFEVRNARPL
jgi:hypothetical protein